MSRRSGSGSYSTMAGLPVTVAGKRPQRGSGSTLFPWTFLITGGADSERSRASLSDLISLAV